MDLRSASRGVARGIKRAAHLQERAANRLARPTLAEARANARAGVGGLWDEMGPLQLDFLKSRGLKPTDTFLDVGCGCLRGGLHLISYLDAGNYYGIDASQGMLDIGSLELHEAGLLDKRPTLLKNNLFEFDKFDAKFDMALAQSVYSHLPLNTIHRSLVRMSEALNPGGVFYATFFHNPGNPRDLQPIEFPQPDEETVITHPDRDPYRYPLSFFEALIEDLPLRLEHVGQWGSKRGQQMLGFHRE